MQAAEKVLAGSIRREMALEEFCAKQTSDIMQLNCLVSFCILRIICGHCFVTIFNHICSCKSTGKRGNAMPQ